MALDPYIPQHGAQPVVGRRGVLYDCDEDGGARVVTSGAPTDAEAETIAADDADRMLPSGYYARPPDGTEGLVVETDAGPAVIGERSDCPISLQQGELALCHWDGDTWVKIGSVDVEIRCKSTGTLTLSGGGSVDFVALAAKVLTELQAIQTALATHTHGGVTTGAGTSGPPAAPPYTAPASVGSTRVKVE